jgi:fatty-acyl-CoA synthase
VTESLDSIPAVTDLVSDGLSTARLSFAPRSPFVTARALAEEGRRWFSPAAPAGAVATVMTNDRTTVSLLLGALEAGTRLVSLPVPAPTGEMSVYLDLVRSACEQNGVQEIVVNDRYVEVFRLGGLNVRAHSELNTAPVAAAQPHGFELVQFSSGSTGRPKAVLLDDRALGANVRAIIDAVEPRSGDHAVSWLPLSHDMGLIGMLLTSICSMSPAYANGGDIIILDPLQFLRSPQLWLSALSETQCSVTAAPDFGYRLCVERSDPRSLDLSHLRCAIVGGETIRANTLESFSDRFAGSGFRRTAFCPSYGMAEVGLAATMDAGDDSWTEVVVDTLELAEGRTSAPRAGGLATRLVGSGRPLRGYDVRIAGAVGTTGRIEISGPSIGSDGRTRSPLAQHDGWFRTGDRGAVIDGGLYVTGRADDYIVSNGRNLYAPAIEEAIGHVKGARAGRAAAIGLPSGEWVVVTEPATKARLSEDASRAFTRDIRRAVVAVCGIQPDAISIVPRGTLAVTSSGKLQRAEIMRRHLSGVAHSPRGAHPAPGAVDR